MLNQVMLFHATNLQICILFNMKRTPPPEGVCFKCIFKDSEIGEGTGLFV